MLATKKWVIKWVQDFLRVERLREQMEENKAIIEAASTVAATTEKKGEAKHECGCPGCHEWRTDWVRQAYERAMSTLWSHTPKTEKDGITPACWRHRIKKLEDQLETLLLHHGVKIVHEPERKVEARYVVEKLPQAAEPSTKGKPRRPKSRTKAR